MLFRASMGVNRFWIILRFIRFDNQKTRVVSLQNDEVAAVRDLWSTLNRKILKKYKRTENLTVD